MGELVDRCAGIGEEDGGVSGDDELGVFGFDEITDDEMEGELATGGQGGFGFVDEIEAVIAEPVLEKSEE